MTRPVVDDPPAEETTAAVRPAGRWGGRRAVMRAVPYAVLALVAAGLLAWLLSWSSPVPIREVVVTGAEGPSHDAVLAAAAIAPDTPIRDVDADAISQRVGALPGIETVELQIQRPWTIVVHVVERFPFALVEKGEGWTVVDASGVEINDQPDKPSGLPIVADVPDRAPVLAALAALPPDLREKIKIGTLAKNGDVALEMRSGTVIQWGLPGPEDATKAQAVRVLLQYRPEKINVSVPERPALSGQLTLPKQNIAPSESP